MIIYSVRVSIQNEVLEDWKQWMKEVHIPDVMNTGIFSACQMSRLLEENDLDSTIFNMQYHCESMDAFNRYQESFAPQLQKDHTERYQGKYEASRSFYHLESNF